MLLTKKSKSLGGWLKDQKLKTKIIVFVIISMILIISTISFVFIQMNNHIENLKSLIANEMEVEEIVGEIAVSGNEMTIALSLYIVMPEGVSAVEALADYEIATGEYTQEKIDLDAGLARMDQEEAQKLEEHIDDLKASVDHIISVASGENGIFAIVDAVTIKGDKFEEELEEVTDDLENQLGHNLTGFIDIDQVKTIKELLAELSVGLWMASSKSYLYQLDFNPSQAEHVNYVYGNIDTTNDADISEHRQFSVILAELRITVGTNDSTLVAILDEIAADLTRLKTETTEWLNLITQLGIYVNNLEQLTGALEKEVFDVQKIIEEHIIEQKGIIEDITNQTVILVIGLVVFVAFVIIAITTWIARITVNPVIKLSQISRLIADGDLTEDLGQLEVTRDEVGELTVNFVAMAEQLRSTVNSIQESSGILTTTSEDLLSGSEEINASAEEVASTSQAMSNGATSQTELISEVNEDVRLTSSMVDNIIKKIQGNTDEVSQIALQTNILALNAGIEASRAGDYGRGFAVVAENVRKLSDQSKVAAEQIAGVANEIAENLQDSFSKISTTMVNVVSVSEETAASAEEVAAAAEEMTATIEELSSAAQELTTQAEGSQKLIDRFTLEKKLTAK